MQEIHDLTTRVRDLSDSIDLWNLVMLWALGFAALSAVVVVVTTRIVFTRTGQLAAASGLLENAKDRQLQKDLKEKDLEIGVLKIRSDTAEGGIANAQKEAGAADERAAKLEVEAARLRKQLLGQERRASYIDG
jgi:hypothetical protein